MAWVNIPKKEFLYNIHDAPAGPTDIATKAVYITSIFITNHSGSTRTVLLQDKASTPRTLLDDAQALDDGDTALFEKKLETALFAEGGLTLTVSGNNVTVQILGRIRGT